MRAVASAAYRAADAVLFGRKSFEGLRSYWPTAAAAEAEPPELTRLGASAVVEIKHGPACR